MISLIPLKVDSYRRSVLFRQKKRNLINRELAVTSTCAFESEIDSCLLLPSSKEQFLRRLETGVVYDELPRDAERNE